MINDFWNLIVETWQTGIRGVGIDDILICLVIIIGALITRGLFNTYLIDKIAKFAESSESTLDDEIVESLRGPFGLIPIAFGLYLITAYLPFTGWGTPHWDPNARGIVLGLTRDTQRGHLARAALEGIALSVATLVKAAEKLLWNNNS